MVYWWTYIVINQSKLEVYSGRIMVEISNFVLKIILMILIKSIINLRNIDVRIYWASSYVREWAPYAWGPSQLH